MSDISCAPFLLTSTGTKRRRQDTLTVFRTGSPLEDLDSLTRWSQSPCAFSLLIVLSGVVFLFFGTKAMRSIVFPLCFLIFMIPLPFIQEIGFYLQTISVHSSAWLLTVVGFSVTTVGPEIHLRDAIFTIGLPCSGINTLIALLALAAVYVYLLM